MLQDHAQLSHHPKPSPLPRRPRPHVHGAPELYRPQKMADLVMISFQGKTKTKTQALT